MVSGNTLYGRSHQQTAAAERDFRPLCGGVACLDFVNTVDRHGSTPDDDYFAPGYANLLDWFEYAQLVDSDNATLLLRLAQKQPRDAAAIRKRAQFLRTAIRGIVVDLASGGTPSPGDLATLNAEVHRACACGSFVAVDQVLQWRWTRNRELDSLLWPIARSAAELLSGAHLVRVRQCAAEECELLFLDASKNGSRRFCSAASCGNATRVRRFRAHRETKAATGA